MVKSCNATLILTFRIYLYSSDLVIEDSIYSDLQYNKDEFLELKAIQEYILTELAQEEDTIIHWLLYRQEAYVNNECTCWISSTSETELLLEFRQEDSKIINILDTFHISY